MSFAARHNKGSVFKCDTEGFEYRSLSDLYEENGPDKQYVIQGLYINRKSEYGPAPVAICLDYFVNLPSYMTDEIETTLKTIEDIEDIRAGKVGFMIEPYEKTVGKKVKICYGINWIDID